MLIDKIATDDVLDVAYRWVCEKRAHHHFNSEDIGFLPRVWRWQGRRWNGCWTRFLGFMSKARMISALKIMSDDGGFGLSVDWMGL